MRLQVCCVLKGQVFFLKILQHHTALVKSEVLLLSILITWTNQWIILLLVIGGRDYILPIGWFYMLPIAFCNNLKICWTNAIYRFQLKQPAPQHQNTESLEAWRVLLIAGGSKDDSYTSDNKTLGLRKMALKRQRYLFIGNPWMHLQHGVNC